MRLSQISAGLILGILAFVKMLNPAFAADVSQDLAKVEKAVEKQNIEHRKLQAQANQINMELTQVSQEMVKTARKVQNSEEKLSQMERQLDVLKESLTKAEEEFALEDDNLIRTLSALQSLALKPTESLFVQPLTPVEIIRSAMLLRETVPHLEANAERIRVELEKIQKKKVLVERQVKEISSQKKILERDHEKMKTLVQKKSKIRNAVEIKSVKAKQNMDKLASQARDLRDLFDKLENDRIVKQRKAEEERLKIEERIRKEEEKIASEKKVEESHIADLIKYNQQNIKDIGQAFVKAKGSMPMPARGNVISWFGEQKVKGVISKGIVVETRSQAQVIAPFDGSVVFAGPFRGYGNMIIIEHGEGYLTLLAGLDTIDAELGQMLLAGEPVGQMPSEGEAHLYVEMRRNNNPVNPLAWFKN